MCNNVIQKWAMVCTSMSIFRKTFNVYHVGLKEVIKSTVKNTINVLVLYDGSFVMLLPLSLLLLTLALILHFMECFSGIFMQYMSEVILHTSVHWTKHTFPPPWESTGYVLEMYQTQLISWV